MGGSRKSHNVQTFAVQTTPNGGGGLRSLDNVQSLEVFFFEPFPKSELRCGYNEAEVCDVPPRFGPGFHLLRDPRHPEGLPGAGAGRPGIGASQQQAWAQHG